MNIVTAGINADRQQVMTIISVEMAPLKALTGLEFEPGSVRGRVIYLIAGEDERVKVGVSSTPRHRLSTVVRAAGVVPSLIAISPALVNATAIEASFKAEYKPKLVNGEWYRVPFAEAQRFIEGEDWIFDTESNANADRERRSSLEEKYAHFNPMNWRP